MIQQIAIERISKKEVDIKNGPKKGQKAMKLGIYDGQEWYNGWENKETSGWKEGDTVEVSISSREYNGKTYYDFAPISQLDRIESKLDIVLSKLAPATAITPENEPPVDDGDCPF